MMALFRRIVPQIRPTRRDEYSSEEWSSLLSVSIKKACLNIVNASSSFLLAKAWMSVVRKHGDGRIDAVLGSSIPEGTMDRQPLGVTMEEESVASRRPPLILGVAFFSCRRAFVKEEAACVYLAS